MTTTPTAPSTPTASPERRTTGAAASLRRLRHQTPGDIAFSAAVAVALTAVVFATLYPIWFVLIASVSAPDLVQTGQVLLFPRGVNSFGYDQIFADARIWQGYRNTLLYAAVGTAVNMLVTIPAAYALSRREFRPRKLLVFFFAFTMFFSGGLIPNYLLYRDLGLLNSMWVFVLPGALNVYNLIIARAFFENSLPEELHEAAFIDGASYFQVFTKMVLPLSKPILAVILLYYLVAHWNDFFTGLVFVRDSDLQPLQVVLRDILLSNNVFAGGSGSAGGSGGTGYGQEFADQIKYGVIIVSTLPVIVVYPFLQKYFEKGVLVGSVKG